LLFGTKFPFFSSSCAPVAPALFILFPKDRRPSEWRFLYPPSAPFTSIQIPLNLRLHPPGPTSAKIEAFFSRVGSISSAKPPDAPRRAPPAVVRFRSFRGDFPFYLWLLRSSLVALSANFCSLRRASFFRLTPSCVPLFHDVGRDIVVRLHLTGKGPMISPAQVALGRPTRFTRVMLLSKDPDQGCCGPSSTHSLL